MFILQVEPLQLGKLTNDKNQGSLKKDSLKDLDSMLTGVRVNEKLSDIDQKLNIHNQSIKDLESLKDDNSSVNTSEIKIPGYGNIKPQSIDNVLSILKIRQEILEQRKDFWDNISKAKENS